MFSPAFRRRREAKPVQEVLHAGLSLVSGFGRGNRCNKFFTPYSFSRGCFLQPSDDAGRQNQRKRFFTPDYLSSQASAEEIVVISSSHLIHFPADVFSSLQRTPGSETTARGSSHLIRIAHGRSEPVLPRFIAPYGGREFGRTGGPVVGSVS
jgi:hypothetical protein